MYHFQLGKEETLFMQCVGCVKAEDSLTFYVTQSSAPSSQELLDYEVDSDEEWEEEEPGESLSQSEGVSIQCRQTVVFQKWLAWLICSSSVRYCKVAFTSLNY